MSGLFECFHCLQRSVVWDNDYNPEDVGYDGEGVVHMLHCSNCGAMIEYVIIDEIINEDEEEEEVTTP